MTIDTETQELLEEISGFYENKQEALGFLTNWLAKSKVGVTLKSWRELRDTEKVLYEKRLKNKISRSTGLLKIALDTSSFTRTIGARSLGGPAYQAERYYQGKSG